MRKRALFILSVGVILNATAQNHSAGNTLDINEGSNIPAQRKKPLVITNASVQDITLGWSNNALSGYSRPSRSICFADPNLNAIIVTHRSGPDCNPTDGTTNSGSVMFDYSKNGEVTWNTAPSRGPVFDPAAGAELA